MCWHKWAKWEQYLYEGVVTSQWGKAVNIVFNELRQKRTCLKCGTMQDEKV